MRWFFLMDANRDGYVSESEWKAFLASAKGIEIPTWDIAIGKLDRTRDNRVSEQEFRYHFEGEFRYYSDLIWNEQLPWPLSVPRKWFQERELAGALLSRLIPLGEKIHLFQGELDVQTPFEDALELKDACASNEHALASFQLPRIGACL